jgi:hypothetical protein
LQDGGNARAVDLGALANEENCNKSITLDALGAEAFAARSVATPPSVITKSAAAASASVSAYGARAAYRGWSQTGARRVRRRMAPSASNAWLDAVLVPT